MSVSTTRRAPAATRPSGPASAGHTPPDGATPGSDTPLDGATPGSDTPLDGATPGSARATAFSRSRVATRQRLIESARSLFAERGLRGVTTHDIAHGAGFAAGTFYLHFADKRELFREIASQSVAVLRDRLEKTVTGARDLQDLVRGHATAMIAFAEDHRDLVRILFSADTDAALVSADVLDELAGAIATIRRERQRSGDVTPDLDPAVLSQAVVGMWARVVAWWAADPSRAPRDVVIETLTRIQLEGTHPGPRP